MMCRFSVPREPSVTTSRGNGKGITPVLDALDALGLPEDALSVAAFLDALQELEQIDQMLRSVESPRNSVLREIERQRFATSQRLRSAAKNADVVDVLDAGQIK
jgi:hypothetical protein